MWEKNGVDDGGFLAICSFFENIQNKFVENFCGRENERNFSVVALFFLPFLAKER